MNLLQEKRRALGVHRLYKGGSSSSNASSNDTQNTTNSTSINTTQTTNNDRRLVLQDATAVGDGSSLWSNANTQSWSNANTQSWSDNDTQTTLYSTTYAADAAVLNTFASSMPDAVRALGSAGASIINGAGGAVVDLNRDSIAANSRAWDSTLEYGAATVDRAIDAMSEGYGFLADSMQTAQDIAKANITGGYGLAGAAISSFTPTENKNADIGKYAMWAAAAVAAAVLLKGSK